MDPPYVLAALVIRKPYVRRDGRPSLDGVTSFVVRRDVMGPRVTLADEPTALYLVVLIDFETLAEHTIGFRFRSPKGCLLADRAGAKPLNMPKSVSEFLFPIGWLTTTEEGDHVFDIIADGQMVSRVKLTVQIYPTPPS
jgi:hypothetical protein